MLAVVKSSIKALFQDIPSTFECQTNLMTSFFSATDVRKKTETEGEDDNCEERRPSLVSSLKALKRAFVAGDSEPDIAIAIKEKRAKLDCSRSSENIVMYEPSTAVKKATIFVRKTESTFEGKKEETEPKESVDTYDCDEIQPASPSKIILIDDLAPRTGERRLVRVSFSLRKAKKRALESTIDSDRKYRKYLAKISPDSNTDAEKELQRNIAKSDFRSMEVYGQFNLGFIIAGLGDDLFIVDQHATDEKFNFETLQKAKMLESQKMVCPQPLNLTPANESLLIENMEVFKRNGFEFNTDAGVRKSSSSF